MSPLWCHSGPWFVFHVGGGTSVCFAFVLLHSALCDITSRVEVLDKTNQPAAVGTKLTPLSPLFPLWCHQGQGCWLCKVLNCALSFFSSGLDNSVLFWGQAANTGLSPPAFCFWLLNNPCRIQMKYILRSFFNADMTWWPSPAGASPSRRCV